MTRYCVVTHNNQLVVTAKNSSSDVIHSYINWFNWILLAFKNAVRFNDGHIQPTCVKPACYSKTLRPGLFKGLYIILTNLNSFPNIDVIWSNVRCDCIYELPYRIVSGSRGSIQPCRVCLKDSLSSKSFFILPCASSLWPMLILLESSVIALRSLLRV